MGWGPNKLTILKESVRSFKTNLQPSFGMGQFMFKKYLMDLGLNRDSTETQVLDFKDLPCLVT